MALVKYNNNSISAVTAAAAIPSGSLVPIKTLTASSSATLSFVHGTDGVVLDSTYPIYKFEFINIHPSTDGTAFSFQSSTNSGSSYGITATTTAFIALHNEANSSAALQYQAGDDEAQSTNFLRLSSSGGNGNDESMSGELKIFSPSSSTFVKHFMATTQFYHDGDISINWFTSGYFNTTSAVDAIQFKMNSGNIDAGKIKLYGIKDS